MKHNGQYFAHFYDRQIKKETENVKNMLAQMWREKLKLKHNKDFKTEKMYNAKVQAKIYDYLMYKSKNSSDSKVKKWGFKLNQLVRNKI